ncbi:MAG: DUF2721 domain-containing protein [Cytophagales bacterium]|nr:DUF2721 domain-containing protein [Cytophagales bacterium]
MELTLATPALLFPTISLLLLAYTNKYVAVANRIRNLHAMYKNEQTDVILQQIRSLKIRIRLIRDMQLVGILCIFFAALCMFLLYQGLVVWANAVFGISLILLMGSIGLSGIEIVLSINALSILLKDIEQKL